MRRGQQGLPVTIGGGDTEFVELTGAAGRGVLLHHGGVPAFEAKLTADHDLDDTLAWRPPDRNLIVGVVDDTATDDVYLSMNHVTRYVGETSRVYNLVRSEEPSACGDIMVPAGAWTDWTYTFTVAALAEGVVSTVITAKLTCDFTNPDTEGWAEQVWWGLDGLRRAE